MDMSTVIDQRNHRNLYYRLAPSTSNGGLEAAPWRAVYLRPRYEAVSARFLTEKGYEAFLPTCKSQRQRSDRYVTLELPLFFRVFVLQVCGTPQVVVSISLLQRSAAVSLEPEWLTP